MHCASGRQPSPRPPARPRSPPTARPSRCETERVWCAGSESRPLCWGASVPSFCWTHPSAVVTGGVVLIICELSRRLRDSHGCADHSPPRARGGAPKIFGFRRRMRRRAPGWCLHRPLPDCARDDERRPGFRISNVVSGIVFAGLLIGRLLPAEERRLAEADSGSGGARDRATTGGSSVPTRCPMLRLKR